MAPAAQSTQPWVEKYRPKQVKDVAHQDEVVRVLTNALETTNERGWKKFMGYIGPGFLVSMAYLDPGNMETDLQAGANHKYGLLWIILIGMVFAFIIQSLSAKLGVATGKHLSEHCRTEYPKFVNYCLWLLAEIAVIAADIPEVIGTAFAINILFHIPVWTGVLITGLSTMLLLGRHSLVDALEGGKLHASLF